MKTFVSDNASGVHSKILEAIVECNKNHDFPYGNDIYTKKAIEKFKELFEKEVDVYFVVNGTGANVIGLSSMLRSYEGVVCAQSTHINVDECGAFERFTGSKIIQVPNVDGKINIDNIKNVLGDIGNEHHTQPKVIAISQVTEMGTIYTVDEIKALANFAHENNMYLHVDGARISNAIVSSGVSVKEMIGDTGVDILSFGGTKNGMMYGEAIICFNPHLNKHLKYIRKQGMQLISKMRFVSAQFIAYLENDLYKQIAKSANESAKILENKLKEFEEIEIILNVDANTIFAKFPEIWLKELENKKYFNIVDKENNIVRLVTSFDTTNEDIDIFIEELKNIKNK